MNSSALDAFIYAERDIYRPGEKINFSVIVRDRYWKVTRRLAVEFQVSFTQRQRNEKRSEKH